MLLDGCPPCINGAIFDMDGVLTDTVSLHYLSWQKLADDENIPFNWKIHEGILGLNREDSLNRLLGDRVVSSETKQELLLRKNHYYLELIQDLNSDHLLPGVDNLLRELKEFGVKIALGSSSKNAHNVLTRLGIIDLFDAIADGNSVSQLKPSPDIFLYAATLINISPNQCLVFEDAPAGVAAALNANMWVVGVGKTEILTKAHLVFPSLAGIHWENLLAKICPNQQKLKVQG